MRSSTLALVPLLALALASAVRAEEPVLAEDAAAAQLEVEADEDPAEVNDASEPESDELVPDEEGDELEEEEAPAAAAPPAAETAAAPPPAPAPARHRVQLGPTGYDSAGRPGRIHVVVRGDTLWDVSDAYLGTPWVWPSVWRANQEIENPHLIRPGDRLWITPTEIRRVTAEEAEALLAGVPASASEGSGLAAEPEPALADAAPERRAPRLRFSYGSAVGLISEEQVEGAASLVSGVSPRTWMAGQDGVFIGLGEGQTQPGDQFAVFRSRQRVYDPDSGAFLGYHVRVLGWIEVKEVHPEVARAEVVISHNDMRVGDRVLPREVAPHEIELRATPAELVGRVVFMPDSRTNMGTLDLVYLDRGREDGLDVGNALEIVRSRGTAREVVQGGAQLKIPDRVVADLVVVSAQPHSAVAVVRHADTELRMGDRFRGSAIR